MSETLQILIVEEDAIVGNDLSDTLIRCGYEVVGLAATVDRALTLARERDPDLLLVDLRMGQGDAGIGAAELLRDQCKAPVVFMTGFSSEEIFNRAKAVRPAGFLRKPFSAWELQAAVENAIEHARLQRELESRGGKFLDTLRGLSDVVVASGLDGKITFFNPSAESLTGYKESEVVGKALSKVLHIQDYDEEEDSQDGAGRTLSLTVADGQVMKIVERSVPLRDEKGEVNGLMTLIRPLDESILGDQGDGSTESSSYLPFCELFGNEGESRSSGGMGEEAGREAETKDHADAL